MDYRLNQSKKAIESLQSVLDIYDEIGGP